MTQPDLGAETPETAPDFSARMRAELLRHRAEILRRQHAPIAERVAEQTEQCQIIRRNEEQAERLGRDRQTLRLIDAALERIAAGEYGVCDCGDVIARKRLVALPWACRCLPCQEREDAAARLRMVFGLEAEE